MKFGTLLRKSPNYAKIDPNYEDFVTTAISGKLRKDFTIRVFVISSFYYFDFLLFRVFFAITSFYYFEILVFRVFSISSF